MQIVVLAGLILSMAFVEPEISGELAPPGPLTPWSLCAYPAVAAMLTALNTLLSRRALRHWGGMPRGVRRRHTVLTTMANLWLVVGSAAVLFSGYGRWLAERAATQPLPLVYRLASAGPFVLSLIVVLALRYPFYRAYRRRSAPDRRPWSAGEYLGYNARHHVLFALVPISLILLGHDAIGLYAEPRLPNETWASVVLIGGRVAVGLGVFFLAPVMIVRIWRTERLGPTPLRGSLESISRRLGLGYRDMRVWKSSGEIANAGVMGLTRHVRYVLLSDGLLENMDPAEIESIFAHEAGHIAGHHIFYSALFALSCVTLCSVAGFFAAWGLGLSLWGEMALTLALTAGAFGLVFGWISRRFERQCDVVAAWAVGREYAAGNLPDPAGEASQAGDAAQPGDADPMRIPPAGAALFARSLQHVGRLNAIPATQPNWRHGSIARRVSYILWLSSRGGTRREIDRTVRWIKAGIWLAVALSAAAFVFL